MNTKLKTNNKNTISIGDTLEVSPDLTLLKNWVIGVVIKIFKNPFIGDEIAIQDKEGRIFFGKKSYFRNPKNENICTQ